MIDAALSYKADLAKGVTRTVIRPALLTGDKLAHTFSIACVRDGTAETLTGSTVSAYFIRADGVTVPMTGSVSGSTAAVTLSEACYAVSGRFQLVVKLTLSGVTSAIFYGDGAVASSQTDAVIDPEGVVPSLSELLAQIAVIEAATTAANTAATSATTAAGEAASAADAIEGMTVAAQTLATGEAATATVSDVGGVKHIVFGLPRGAKGDTGATGSVENLSVNGVSAVSGEITVTGANTAVSAADSTTIDKAIKKAGNVCNLLDNAEFAVNQREASGTITAAGYFVDRWKLASGSVTINENGSLTLNGTIKQVLPAAAGTATAACDGGAAASYDDATSTFSITGSGQTITWAALYQGTYAADTLPPFVSKGYAAELAACQLYFRRYLVGNGTYMGYAYSSTIFRFVLPGQMRGGGSPTVTFIAGSDFYVRGNGSSTQCAITEMSVNTSLGAGGTSVAATTSGMTSFETYTMYSGSGTAKIDLSRDL